MKENILTGPKFDELISKAKEIGVTSLDYSSRKNNKYMVTLPSGKKSSFWFTSI